MNAIRLFAAAAAAAVLAAAPKTPSNEAEYVAGSIQAPVLNTKGTLDLSDANEMKFRFKDGVFAIPYARLASAEPGRPAGIAGKMRSVAGFVTRSKTGHFTIGFKDQQGAVQTMTFAARREQVAKTVPALQAKIPKPVESAVAPGQQSEDWWGDRYWKTNRNLNKWPGSAQAATAK